MSPADRPATGPIVKICGITREEDALAAAEAGADRIGFVFAPSPRRVSLERAAAIARALPASVEPVGVFVDPAPGDVERAFDAGAIRRVQFHGSESVAACRAVGRSFTRAVRVRSAADVDRACAEHAARPGEPDAPAARGEPREPEELLVDPFVEGQPGGTGRTLDDSILGAIARARAVRVILAGGLDPSNVAERLERIAAPPGGTLPFGVDASSRLEAAPGVKDPAAVRAFVAAARGAFERLSARANEPQPQPQSQPQSQPQPQPRTEIPRGTRGPR